MILKSSLTDTLSYGDRKEKYSRSNLKISNQNLIFIRVSEAATLP